MNREKVDKAVIEVLGFNPQELKYKIQENSREIEEIKNMLKQTIPAMGRYIIEYNLLQEFLKLHGLDATEFIASNLKTMENQVKENNKLKKVSKNIDEDKKEIH